MRGSAGGEAAAAHLTDWSILELDTPTVLEIDREYKNINRFLYMWLYSIFLDAIYLAGDHRISSSKL
jgi:hypothetical protein